MQTLFSKLVLKNPFYSGHLNYFDIKFDMNEGTIKWVNKKKYPYSPITRVNVYFCYLSYLLYQPCEMKSRNMTTYNDDINCCL